MSSPACAVAGEQSAAEHATRYELLRRHVLEPHAAVSRYGLAVLLRAGLAAWMQMWSQVPEPPPRSVKADSPSPSPLPHESSAELVRLLAAMTLGHMQELHA